MSRRRSILLLSAAFAASLLLAEPAAGAADRWTTVGPSYPEVELIAVDSRSAQTIYVIADHRLFRSVDGGQSWRSINPTSGSDDDAVYSFAIDPSRPDTLYAGRSFGLVRSDDGGATWSGFVALGFVRGIAVASFPVGPLYFHTGEALYRTDDGGAHDTKLTVPWSADEAISALAVDPTRADTVYVGVHGAGVFRSRDGGAHWTSFGLGLPEAPSQIVINPGETSTIYAVTPNGGLYATADITNVWLPIGPPGKAVITVAVDPNDATRLLAGADGVYESANGGDSWTLLPVLTDPVNAPDLIDSLAVAGAIYAGTTYDGLFRSDDAGQSWVRVDVGLPGASTSALDASSAGTVFAAGGSRPSRRTARAAWETGGPLGTTSISADRSGSIVYAGTGSCAERPHDSPVCVGALFRSIDGGGTWTQVLDGAIYAVAVDPTRPATAYASVATGGFAGLVLGTIFKTGDGGAHWIDAGGPPSFVLSRLWIDPGQTNRLFATDSYEVFRSDDRGAHWIESGTEFEPARVADLAAGITGDPRVYIATSNGVFRSATAGEIWDATTFEEGAETVAVDPSDPRTVYVGTHLGVFRSSDAGDTWQPVSLGLGGSPVYVLRVDPTGNVLYAGTQTGVFEFDIRRTRTVPARPALSAERKPLR